MGQFAGPSLSLQAASTSTTIKTSRCMGALVSANVGAAATRIHRRS
jgi:hypothetical protein